ncbi:MAG: site-specific integrase, partial [Candidatus Bathyarchaeia archaeon]
MAAATQPEKQAAGATSNPTEPSVQGKFVEFAWWLKKQGYADSTVTSRAKLLRILTRRGANLYDPELVKAVIAKQTWSEGRKSNAVDAYTSFLKMNGAEWEPPRYQGVHKIPF